MTTNRFATLVERGHGFVSRTGLDLHEECLVVIALWTGGFRGVHVLPGSRSAEHVVYLLQLWVSFVTNLLPDVLNVWTG